MKAFVLLLVLGLLVSAAFAQSCVSSADCDEDSYCGSDGYCHSYYGDNGYGGYGGNVSCCGAGLVLLAGVSAAVLTNQKK